MKNLISKHYRKVFARDPKAMTEWSTNVLGREEFGRVLSGEPGDGDVERLLLETHLDLHRLYGPVQAWKIEKQFIKLLAMMWR